MPVVYSLANIPDPSLEKSDIRHLKKNKILLITIRDDTVRITCIGVKAVEVLVILHNMYRIVLV